jgi:hypothetical protein
MSVLCLVNDKRYRQEIISLCKKGQLSYQFTESVEGLLKRSLEDIPRIFFIQDDKRAHLRILDLIKDLRNLFGAVVTIVIINDENPGIRLASLISAGADNFFRYPFDQNLTEDFLFKSAHKNIYRPFKYRNVPSGEPSVQLQVELFFTEINEEGVKFEAKEFLMNGVIFEISLETMLSLEPLSSQVRVRVISSTTDELNRRLYFAEYFRVPLDIRKMITYKLKS